MHNPLWHDLSIVIQISNIPRFVRSHKYLCRFSHHTHLATTWVNFTYFLNLIFAWNFNSTQFLHDQQLQRRRTLSIYIFSFLYIWTNTDIWEYLSNQVLGVFRNTAYTRTKYQWIGTSTFISLHFFLFLIHIISILTIYKHLTLGTVWGQSCLNLGFFFFITLISFVDNFFFHIFVLMFIPSESMYRLLIIFCTLDFWCIHCGFFSQQTRAWR